MTLCRSYRPELSVPIDREMLIYTQMKCNAPKHPLIILLEHFVHRAMGRIGKMRELGPSHTSTQPDTKRLCISLEAIAL